MCVPVRGSHQLRELVTPYLLFGPCSLSETLPAAVMGVRSVWNTPKTYCKWAIAQTSSSPTFIVSKWTSP